jgi:hypothetical protein
MVRRPGASVPASRCIALHGVLVMGAVARVLLLSLVCPPAAVGQSDAVLDPHYAGPKAALRPIHDAVLAAMQPFGPFEAAPRKSYVSDRRSRQFRMVGPATDTRVEVGLNMKGVPGTDRLEALPAGQMCQHKVRVTAPAQVDAELVAWIRQAYDAAG